MDKTVVVPVEWLHICEEELRRGTLTSLPLKLEFMKERGLANLEAVHEWMTKTREAFKSMVIAAAPAPAAQDELGETLGAIRDHAHAKEDAIGASLAQKALSSYAALTAPQDAQERDAITTNLAMFVRRLSLSLNRYASHHGLADQAMNYLREIGMFGSPLRDTAQPADKPEEVKRREAEAQQLRYALRSLQYIADDEQGDAAKFAALSIKHITCGTYKPEGKAEQQAEPVAWIPYLSDRADGCKGRYAIARWNPAGYREVWNLHQHKWAAFSDDVLTLEQAQELMRNLVIPTAQPQQLTDEEIKLLAAEYLCDEYGFWRAPETSEIMNFARALLAAQGGKDKSAAPGQDGREG